MVDDMGRGAPRAANAKAHDPADIEDDRHDTGRAREIDSRHEVHSPVADPILPGRPRAPLGPWLWLSALIALASILIIAAIATRFMG